MVMCCNSLNYQQTEPNFKLKTNTEAASDMMRDD